MLRDPAPFRLISRWNQSSLQAHFSLDKTRHFVSTAVRGTMPSRLIPPTVDAQTGRPRESEPRAGPLSTRSAYLRSTCKANRCASRTAAAFPGRRGAERREVEHVALSDLLHHGVYWRGGCRRRGSAGETQPTLRFPAPTIEPSPARRGAVGGTDSRASSGRCCCALRRYAVRPRPWSAIDRLTLNPCLYARTDSRSDVSGLSVDSLRAQGRPITPTGGLDSLRHSARLRVALGGDHLVAGHPWKTHDPEDEESLFEPSVPMVVRIGRLALLLCGFGGGPISPLCSRQAQSASSGGNLRRSSWSRAAMRFSATQASGSLSASTILRRSCSLSWSRANQNSAIAGPFQEIVERSAPWRM